MKVLCVFGKHNYGDAARGIGIEYGSFIPALRRLGHEVVHFDPWDRRLFSDFAQLNRSLVETVEREHPQVMLVVPIHYEVWVETLRIIQARGDVATICWTTDDSWKYDQFSRLIGPYYHAMTTTYSEMIPRYHRDGIRNVLLTQWAANSEWLHPPLPATACRYPVTFVGMAHGNRQQRVAELRAQGIEVRCFGYGWPDGPIATEEIPRIIHESVISLNFSNNFERFKGRNQIKARTFEVPGAGGFLLTEAAPGLETWYAIGKEIAVFDDTENLVRQIRYFLSNPTERDRIAQAGFERTRREHTYDARLRELVDFAMNAQQSESGKRPAERLIDFEQACQTHRLNAPLRWLRQAMLMSSIAVWGRQRGPRAVRRMLFETSWRLRGVWTYSAAGWPGRMFYQWS